MTEPSDLLTGDVVDVARALLGWRLVSDIGGASTEVVLTEVEAYRGRDDPASHAYSGRTERNAVMFGPAGRLYVYLSYGIHDCANVVTGHSGEASAVLMRAGRVTRGRSAMEKRRGRSDHLTDGPGKLCRALGISRDHYGVDLMDPGSVVRLIPDAVPESSRIIEGPRVGISRATDLQWRFRLIEE